MHTNKKSGKQYSKYHPTRPCTKYVLYKSNTYYSHYGAWGDDEKDFL